MPDSPPPEATSHDAVTPVVAHVSSGRLKLAALVAGGVAAVVVVGGLICATIATLLFVPVVFAVLHGRKAARPVSLSPSAPPAQPASPEAGQAVA